uniref:KH domain-containing protein n=1 Tax=Caenorhabditis tropicalis TaxID=1561998 RepID=A0A1I7U566_9PELO
MSNPRRGFYEDSRHHSSSWRSKASREYEEDEISVPTHVVPMVVGQNNQGIDNIRALTGCDIRVRQAIRTQGYRLVKLKGKRESIEFAKRHIFSIIQTAENQQMRGRAGFSTPGQMTIEIPIPANQCGKIIGKGGEMMRRIRSVSNCQIVLIQENNSPDAVKPLRITGTPDSIKIAEAFVRDLLNSTDSPNASSMVANGPQNQMCLTMSVPRDVVGAIMGLQGSQIKKLSEETGTKIQFMQDDDPSLLERKLTVMGTTARIEMAVRVIKKIVEDNHDNSIKAIYELKIPAQKCGLVIGRGGEIIKQINQETGAHCELSHQPDEDPMTKMIVIHARTERQVDHAKHLILQKLGDIPLNVPFGAVQPPPLQYPPYPGQMMYPPHLQYPYPQLQYQPYHPLQYPPQEPRSPYAQQFFQHPYPPPPPQVQYPVQYDTLTPNFIYPPTEKQGTSSNILSKMTPEGVTTVLNQLRERGDLPEPPPEVREVKREGSERKKEAKRRQETPELIDLTEDTEEQVDYTKHWENYYRKIGDKEGLARIKKMKEQKSS